MQTQGPKTTKMLQSFDIYILKTGIRDEEYVRDRFRRNITSNVSWSVEYMLVIRRWIYITMIWEQQYENVAMATVMVMGLVADIFSSKIFGDPGRGAWYPAWPTLKSLRVNPKIFLSTCALLDIWYITVTS